MTFKKCLFAINIFVLQAKAQSNVELRAKVLNALRTKTEVSEIKVSSSESDLIRSFRYSFSDLNPASVQIQEKDTAKVIDINELMNVGFNADVLSYSFFNSEYPKPFGMNKAYHITYTAVKTDNNSLSHFLVYYHKTNFYPVKVTYYSGSKKITTVEYLDYKKLKNKVWRAHVITSENHLNQRRSRIEFTKIEINSEPSKLRMGKDVSVNPV